MTMATEFPAFIKIEHRPNRAAETAFLSELGGITTIGARRFAEFSKSTNASLQRTEQQFASFSEEARRAIDAITDSAMSGGGFSLDVDRFQREAAAMELKAQAARELALATELAAKEAGDHSQTARLQIAAVQAAAKEAEEAARQTRNYAEAQEQLQRALDQSATRTGEVIDRMAGFGTTAGRVGAANDNLRYGLQNLGYQLGDVSTMFALGARPMQIFASQGSQVVQAVQQMSGGTSRLAGFLGGPWGIALTSAAIAVTPLIGKLLEAEEGFDDLADAAEDAMARVRTSLANVSATSAAATENVKKLLAAQSDLARAQRDFDQADDLIEAFAGQPGGTEAVQIYAQQRADAAEALAAAQERIDQANGALAELRSLDVPLRIAEQNRARLAGSGEDRATNRGGRADALVAEQRAQDRAIEASEAFIATLDREIATLGLTGAALRQAEVERELAAAATADLRKQIDERNSLREQAYSELARRDAIRADARASAEFESQVLAPLERELALLGLVGPQRSLAALALEEEAFKAHLLAQGVFEVNSKWEEYLRLRTEIIEGESALARERQEAELFTAELARLVTGLNNLGAAGSAIGGLLGFVSGSPLGGPLGTLLQTQLGTVAGDDGEVIARTLGDELRDVFGRDGPFGETLSRALFGAGTGVLAGSALFGRQSTTEQLFSGVGGVLGQEAGEALTKGLSGILGSAGGPLGAIAGGVVGGLVGKLFGSTKFGTASISGTDSLGITSKGKGRAEGATVLGESLQDALRTIARELDAEVGNFLVSVGTFKDDFRVSTTGRTGKLKDKFTDVRDFGSDEAAAIAFALSDAIADGAIRGLTQAESRLLRATDDVSRALGDVLDFRDVFARLKSYNDPVGAALDELDAEFNRLDDLFKRAGASAAEYAELEELYGIERANAIREATEAATGSLRDLLSDLTISDSGLSLRDRQSNAVTEYEALATRVQAGDITAADDFAEAAQNLLEIERQIYGSQSGYFDRFNEVRDISQSALKEQQALIDAASNRDSPFGDNASVVSAVDSQTANLGGKLDQQLALMGRNMALLEAQNDNLIALARTFDSNRATAQNRLELYFGRSQGW